MKNINPEVFLFFLLLFREVIDFYLFSDIMKIYPQTLRVLKLKYIFVIITVHYC